jgi:hypothetical protein
MQVTAEVHPTTFEARPYKVVFKRDDSVFAEWPVVSVKAGEQRIAETFSAMAWRDPRLSDQRHVS